MDSVTSCTTGYSRHNEDHDTAGENVGLRSGNRNSLSNTVQQAPGIKTEGLSTPPDDTTATDKKTCYQWLIANIKSITAGDVFRYSSMVAVTGACLVTPALLKENNVYPDIEAGGITAGTTSGALLYDMFVGFKFDQKLIEFYRQYKQKPETNTQKTEEQLPLFQQVKTTQETQLPDNKNDPGYLKIISEPSIQSAMTILAIDPDSDNLLLLLEKKLSDQLDRTERDSNSESDSLAQYATDGELPETKLRSKPSLTDVPFTDSDDIEGSPLKNPDITLQEAYNLLQSYKASPQVVKKTEPLATSKSGEDLARSSESDGEPSKDGEDLLNTTTV